MRNTAWALVVGTIAIFGMSATVFADHPDQLSDPPPGYYDPALGKTEQALRAALHEIIDDHTRISYAQVWDILATADEDPANAANVLTI
jgi:hypothetical protein